MKNSGRITGMVIMLLIAGTFTLTAQRGMRGNNDFQTRGRGAHDAGTMRGRPIFHADSAFVRGMGRGFAMGPGNGFRHGAPLIPNLTTKQIADIEALNVKQRDEMVKFREENAKKIQSMRDEHRKKFLEILTDEQKKAYEAAIVPKNPGAKPTVPAQPAPKK